MPFVQTKSKYDNSTCSFEKEGMKCSNTWKKDEEYIWDTEGKKAYCLKHEEINSKVVKSGGGGGFQKASMPLCRPIDEAIGASQQFNQIVVPMIRQQAKEDFDVDSPDKDLLRKRIDFWTEIYLENFLGKLRPR